MGPDTCVGIGVGAVELESGAYTSAGGRHGECASMGCTRSIMLTVVCGVNFVNICTQG